RRHGGALPQFWPIAAVVNAEIGDLEQGWKKALEWKRRLQGHLARFGSLEVARVGCAETNSFWLCPKARDATAFKAACADRGIRLGDIVGDRVLARVNPQVLPRDAEEIAETIGAAARA